MRRIILNGLYWPYRNFTNVSCFNESSNAAPARGWRKLSDTSPAEFRRSTPPAASRAR